MAKLNNKIDFTKTFTAKGNPWKVKFQLHKFGAEISINIESITTDGELIHTLRGNEGPQIVESINIQIKANANLWWEQYHSDNSEPDAYMMDNFISGVANGLITTPQQGVAEREANAIFHRNTERFTNKENWIE